MAIVRHWVATALAFLLVATLMPGFQVRDPIAALIASAALGLLNALVRPILVVLTLPLTLVTLGLFLLIINGALLWLVSELVPGIHVTSPGTALLAAILVSVASWILSGLLRILARD